MDYYCLLTSVLHQRVSFSFRCDSKFYDYLPIDYWLQVTICTVTRQVFLKVCVKTQCLVQSTFIAK